MSGQIYLGRNNTQHCEFSSSRSDSCSKSALIITILALIALGAVAVGILAIVASFPNSLNGLSAMRHLGLSGGISLLTAGALTLMILCVISCYRHYHAKQPHILSRKSDKKETESVLKSLPTIKPPPEEQKNSFSVTQENSSPSPTIDSKLLEEQKTNTILQGLDFEALTARAPALKAEHILCFKNTQLQNKEFPWASFIQKPNIGRYMRLWGPEVLAAAPIPWGELNQDEIEVLFSLYGTDGREKTNAILQGLNFEALTALAPALKADHILCFKDTQLQNKEFPWSEFIKKDGIGGLFLVRWDFVPALPIPWKKLAQKKNEINTLFSLDPNEKKKTDTILQGLDFEALTALAHALKAEHILCFKDTQLQSKEFPWSEFIKKANIACTMSEWDPDILITQLKKQEFPWASFIQKPRIGRYMRLWGPKVLAAAPIPWGKLNQDEISVLFSLYDTDEKEKTDAILQGLDFEALNALAPALKAKYILCFKDTQLQNKEFPWSEFIKKDGIGGLFLVRWDLSQPYLFPGRNLLKRKTRLRPYTAPTGGKKRMQFCRV